MFQFYQEVRVATPIAANAEHAAATGVILGVGDEPGQPPNYGVYLYDLERVVCFEAGELAPTGRQFARDDLYPDFSSWTQRALRQCGRTQSSER